MRIGKQEKEMHASCMSVAMDMNENDANDCKIRSRIQKNPDNMLPLFWRKYLKMAILTVARE
jgi:hypothetical protein